MASAEKAHQIGNQSEAQEDGKAEKQDADDFCQTAVRFLLLFVFLRFGVFAFGRFFAFFRNFLFGFLFLFGFFGYGGLYLHERNLG